MYEKLWELRSNCRKHRHQVVNEAPTTVHPIIRCSRYSAWRAARKAYSYLPIAIRYDYNAACADQVFPWICPKRKVKSVTGMLTGTEACTVVYWCRAHLFSNIKPKPEVSVCIRNTTALIAILDCITSSRPIGARRNKHSSGGNPPDIKQMSILCEKVISIMALLHKPRILNILIQTEFIVCYTFLSPHGEYILVWEWPDIPLLLLRVRFIGMKIQ